MMQKVYYSIMMVLVILTTQSAAAASFDCAAARGLRETAICNDPVLSKADDLLATTYQDDLRRVSAKAAAEIRADENSWILTSNAQCNLLPSGIAFSKVCLRDKYKTRQIELSRLIQIHGPYTFYMVYKTQRQLLPVNNAFLKLLVSTSTYPQIDHADTPELRAWNDVVSRNLDRAPVCANGYQARSNYVAWVEFATPAVIGIRGLSGRYCVTIEADSSDYSLKGTDAPIQSTLFLLPRLHQPTAVDVFLPNSGWRTDLDHRVAEKVRLSNAARMLYPVAKSSDWTNSLFVATVGEQSWRWTILPYSLEVRFGKDEWTGGPVNIRWQDLASELRPGLGLPAPRMVCQSGDDSWEPLFCQVAREQP